MTWLAIHPDLTEAVQLPEGDATGPVFTFGFFPALEDIRIRARLSKTFAEAPDPVTHQKEFSEHMEFRHATFREVAKWSVRGWTGAPIESKAETVKVGGVERVALSEESLDVLQRGGLLVLVADYALTLNTLTPEQKKSFASQLKSNSSTHGTAAGSASPDTLKAKDTEPSPNTTANTSTDALTK